MVISIVPHCNDLILEQHKDPILWKYFDYIMKDTPAEVDKTQEVSLTTQLSWTKVGDIDHYKKNKYKTNVDITKKPHGNDIRISTNTKVLLLVEKYKTVMCERQGYNKNNYIDNLQNNKYTSYI